MKEKKQEMSWFAIFKPAPPPFKFMVVKCEHSEPFGTIEEYMLGHEKFSVRFERHRSNWNDKFPEI